MAKVSATLRSDGLQRRAAQNVVPLDARRRPYIDDPECPRKPDLAKDRQCLKKCLSDLDCKSKKRRCLCDGVCGRSCVKPSKRCDHLPAVSNGKYEILQFNRFGARARYTCGEGYILSGHPERRCQGDGRWSGRSPTCETEGEWTLDRERSQL
ncbi:hypothetical protein NP493_268g03007 [Ridgeia piscesae]|uniref:Sushi domain-containing protein n=1 Tax=Ridgeia piscesae TaxID=27915 RepID=A0AAD9NXL8_RIDPI|nr:hypothetical protein NP493_268g03007 [Ridgeia piscesae]